MNKIIQMAVMAAVGVILVLSLCLPLVNASTAETRTVNNEGAYFTEPDEETHTIVYYNDKCTVDNATVDYPEGFVSGTNRNATIAIGGEWMLRLDNNYLRLQLGGPNNTYTAETIPDEGITATLTGTTLSLTLNGTDYALENCAYYLADTGGLVMCYNPYILADSELIGGIRANGDNNNGVVYDVFQIISGNVTDGFTSTVCRAVLFTSPSTLTTVSSTFTSNTSVVEGDLLKLDSIIENMVFVDESTGEATITYLLAPATITYDNPDYVGSDLAALLDLIPLLLIVALVVAVVAYAVRARLS